MTLDFNAVDPTVVPHFKGGAGEAHVRTAVADGMGRILTLTLPAGSSIGLHTHTGNCEIIHVLSGCGVCHDDGMDVPLTAAELKEMPAQTVLVPTSLGAVEIAYHLDGVDNLRLTGELVADIYLGRVTKWNDARIASVNPGVSLPDKEIYPVFRLDGSGTTYVFTHYLSSVSPAWAESVGTGKSLTFPRGVAATGTPGVAGLVEKIPGAIGYVASGYSASFDIQRALLQNAAGNYVQPSTESITAAAALQTADTNVMLTDSPAAEAYPISCFSWVMLYRNQSYSGRTREQAEQTLAVLRWLVGPEAQNLAAREHYAPLPTAVAARAVELLDSVTYGGKPLK